MAKGDLCVATMTTALIACFLLGVLTPAAVAQIEPIPDMQIPGSAPFSSIHGMYAPDDAPATGGPNVEGRAYIKALFSFTNSGQSSSYLLMAAFLAEEAFSPNLTAKLQDCCIRTGCEEYATGSFLARIIEPTTKKNVATFTFFPQVSGEYRFYISDCDPTHQANSSEPSYLSSAHVEWMHPYGYLPGEYYGLWPFYEAMVFIILGVSVLWAILCIRFWREMLQVQFFISAVLFIYLLEMSSWYFDYLSFNKTGYRYGFWVGIFFTSARRSLSRMLVVAVSYGFGVMRPRLDPTTRRQIMAAGALYLFFSIAYENARERTLTHQYHSGTEFMLVIPVALLDGIFYWWVFATLSQTVQQLNARRQSLKLLTYKRFQYVLVFSLVIAFLFTVYQMYATSTMQKYLHWKSRWIFTAFWQIMASVIMLSIMFLWAPSKYSNRYAYSEQLPPEEMEDDEEGAGTLAESSDNFYADSHSRSSQQRSTGGDIPMKNLSSTTNNSAGNSSAAAAAAAAAGSGASSSAAASGSQPSTLQVFAIGDEDDEDPTAKLH